jgi:hypothetical protein
MKKIVIVLVLLIPLFLGCSDTILNPETTTTADNAQRGWITLPKNPAISVEDEYSESNIIDGNKGGGVHLKVDYKSGSSGHIKIDAKIKVPKGAFTGEKNITMIINSNDGTAQFYPSPTTFSEPLEYDLVIQGLDLTGIDPAAFQFVYLAPDGSFAPVDCHNIEVKIKDCILKVDHASIPHFSSYGWTRCR